MEDYEKNLLVGILILVFSCVQESVEDIPDFSNSVKSSTEFKGAMRVKTLTVKLTEAEENFHSKILRLSSREFHHLSQTLSQDELEEFAISFLIEESKALLIENGLGERQLKKEYQEDDIKLIHQDLEIYGEKVNRNQ